MTAPLYTGHGHTIQDPVDGFHTADETNGFIDGIKDIPRDEVAAYFAAISPHWEHIHFAEGGDHVRFQKAKDGSINIWSDFTTYEGVVSRDDLDIPNVFLLA